MDPKKKLHDLCQSVLCMFSSRSFRVSGLTFRSLIRFEFFCVYCVRECSNFILLHVAVQFSPYYPSFEETVFSSLCILAFVINY